MKMFEVVIGFLNPSKIVGTVQAETEEEARLKILADLQEQAPDLVDVEIESIKEVIQSAIILDINGNPQ